jgi:cytochrome c oxidase cbb3-type subunit 3
MSSDWTRPPAQGVRAWALAWALMMMAMPACEREQRNFREPLSAIPGGAAPPTSSFQPGPPVQSASIGRRYEKRAYDVSEGKRLFSQFNCVGCHGRGGGGIGPALMDQDWIYGGATDQIVSSILQGRPNGMPAYGGRLVPQQVWQLAAYVRSLSGLVAKDVAPGRDDAMQVTAQEQQTTERTPATSGTPSQSVQP